jgi:hypothetical protein
MITVSTSNAAGLLQQVKAAIGSGHVQTWSVDKDGDFTHTPPQWQNKAWLRPSTVNGSLVLNLLKPQNAQLTWEVYAVYHGRFIEMLIAHFNSSFSIAQGTASPAIGDKV